MSIRCFWVISVSNKHLLVNRTFLAIESRAKSSGSPPLPTLASADDETLLVQAVLSALLVNTQQNDSHKTSFLNDIPIETHERSTLPALEILFKGCKLWPIIICEQSGLLYCSLPLIEHTNVKSLVDHLPVSVTFAFLQQAVSFLANNSLTDLDDFLASVVPLGRYIGLLPKAPSYDRKQDDLIISLSVQEKLSHSVDEEKDKIFGTISIDFDSSKMKSDHKANINLLLRNLSTLEMAMSPACFKSTEDTISVNLSRRDTQLIHYWKPNHDFPPFIEYSFEAWKQQLDSYRLQLIISLDEAYALNRFKFTYFNVLWREAFKDQYKPCNVNCTHGQITTDVNRNFVWALGSKLPRTSKAVFSCDITAKSGLGETLVALCSFEVKDWSMAVTLNRECITITDGFPYPPKLLMNKSISSTDYKVRWTLVPNPSDR